MTALFKHSLVLADGITIHVGNNTWTFGSNIIVYLLIAAVVGIVAEFIVGWRLPFGIIGAVIAGVIGIWLVTQVLSQFVTISGFNDPTLDGVPLIHALIGAVILVAVWHLLTYRSWGDRSRYNRRS